MANPVFGADRAVMFYCGDDADAKKTVHQLASELGFDARDAGPLKQARVLEPFAMLWISLAMQGGRDFAFKLIQRQRFVGRPRRPKAPGFYFSGSS
jgi:predicted dinucleotide-binding enzyme